MPVQYTERLRDSTFWLFQCLITIISFLCEYYTVYYMYAQIVIIYIAILYKGFPVQIQNSEDIDLLL